MAKARSVFFCQECGYESSKWMGQCPACHAWNTFVEEAPIKGSGSSQASGGGRRRGSAKEPVRLSGIKADEEVRTGTGIGELDRVLGGGIVRGSLVLVGGDPGIGKSTLLLQMCRNLAEQGVRVLYVSGEESLVQIRMRAERIGIFKNDIYLLCETDLEDIRETVLKYRPQVLIIDSIQTMYCDGVSSGPGSVSQVREATNILMQLAKQEGVSVFIIGHVTKEGVVAGPRVLEHMVDTVLYFEGDRQASYRILRSVKNRFGSTNEIGVFEMKGSGLEQVLNPSEFMLGGRPQDASGSVVSCALEGTRPILVEVQALVCRTSFQIPRRTAAGIDYNRVNLLMAVLEKRVGLKLGSCDAYINLAGGMKLNEPSLDMAVAAAVVSSYMNAAMPPDTLVFGEIGLSGEIRSVTQAENRIREAAKLGFKHCLMPASNVERIEDLDGRKRENGLITGSCQGISLSGMSSVRDLCRYISAGAKGSGE